MKCEALRSKLLEIVELSADEVMKLLQPFSSNVPAIADGFHQILGSLKRMGHTLENHWASSHLRGVGETDQVLTTLLMHKTEEKSTPLALRQQC